MDFEEKNLDAIGLAEYVMALLDQGSFTATYKYAVLLALIDLCLEQTSKTGQPPSMVTTAQLAVKVIDIYWPHTAPFKKKSSAVLFQNTGTNRSQAEIVRKIEEFRTKQGGLSNLSTAKRENAAGYLRLVKNVEWKLIQMPLPRLQLFGKQLRPYLYSINWDKEVKLQEVRAYQNGNESDFDNRIQFKSGVAKNLIKLNNLLRPLIHRQWTIKVSQINKLPESRLETFLFGATRIGTDRIRPVLEEFQSHRCFYCEDRIGSASKRKPEVDHFIPWSRYPENGLANLVVAHNSCNNHKRDFLADASHVKKWLLRLDKNQAKFQQFEMLSQDTQWDMRDVETAGIAAAIYLNLAKTAELWHLGDEFRSVDRAIIENVFTVAL